jgi:hypothetical protein
MNPRDVRGVLRWYPATWRRRYGQELIAMLDDTYGNEKLPRRARMSLIRSGLVQRVRQLRKFSRTYVGYSIACAIVWAIILTFVWIRAGGTTTWHTFTVFAGGWAIGWLSASIGRVVYPPPKTRRPAA